MVKVSHKQLTHDVEKDEQAGKLLHRMHGESEEEQAAQLASQYDLSYVDLNIGIGNPFFDHFDFETPAQLAGLQGMNIAVMVDNFLIYSSFSSVVSKPITL
jgi:hypothetical protein